MRLRDWSEIISSAVLTTSVWATV